MVTRCMVMQFNTIHRRYLFFFSPTMMCVFHSLMILKLIQGLISSKKHVSFVGNLNLARVLCPISIMFISAHFLCQNFVSNLRPSITMQSGSLLPSSTKILEVFLVKVNSNFMSFYDKKFCPLAFLVMYWSKLPFSTNSKRMVY